MAKIPIPPPQLPPIPNKEEIQNIKTYKLSEEKKAYIHEKYENPLQERKKKRKKQKRAEWWSKNTFNIIATILAIIGIIIALIGLL